YLLMNVYGAGLRQSCQKLFWFNRWLGDFFYFILPHFEFFDLRQRFVHEWEPLPARLVIFLTLYAFGYALFFLGLGWARFRKQFL
ncbi:MAG: hypothetical protein WCG06_06140, partial [Candidatus Omnitrophota bacterium]